MEHKPKNVAFLTLSNFQKNFVYFLKEWRQIWIMLDLWDYLVIISDKYGGHCHIWKLHLIGYLPRIIFSESHNLCSFEKIPGTYNFHP